MTADRFGEPFNPLSPPSLAVPDYIGPVDVGSALDESGEHGLVTLRVGLAAAWLDPDAAEAIGATLIAAAYGARFSQAVVAEQLARGAVMPDALAFAEAIADRVAAMGHSFGRDPDGPPR